MKTQEQLERNLEERARELLQSPRPSNLAYAEQAIDEIGGLELYFSILQDIFASKSTDSVKLKKAEYLLGEFKRSFEAWTDLTVGVLSEIPDDAD